MSNTNTMNATESQFAKIKTGPETALYLRRYNAMCKKTAAGERTRQPSASGASSEIAEMNAGIDLYVRLGFLQSLRSELFANHGLA